MHLRLSIGEVTLIHLRSFLEEKVPWSKREQIRPKWGDPSGWRSSGEVGRRWWRRGGERRSGVEEEAVDAPHPGLCV